MSKNKILLTDRELAIVWSIVAWFGGKRPASSNLVQSLYPGDDNKYNYVFDEQIEDRIIDIADFLKRRREAEAIRESLPDTNGDVS